MLAGITVSPVNKPAATAAATAAPPTAASAAASQARHPAPAPHVVPAAVAGWTVRLSFCLVGAWGVVMARRGFGLEEESSFTFQRAMRVPDSLSHALPTRCPYRCCILYVQRRRLRQRCQPRVRLRPLACLSTAPSLSSSCWRQSRQLPTSRTFRYA